MTTRQWPLNSGGIVSGRASRFAGYVSNALPLRRKIFCIQCLDVRDVKARESRNKAARTPELPFDPRLPLELAFELGEPVNFSRNTYWSTVPGGHSLLLLVLVAEEDL